MMIDIDHVSFQYSGAERENLQNFNLQIEKGECVVLTGESGCGKTCVTRLINTLIPHFYEGEMSGTVLIDGVDTRTIQPHDLSDKIGSVFQNPRSQFFSLDTDSEIVFGMENKGMPYQVMLDRYQQTIQELHIEKLMDRNLFDLSGGQKQTIAFASVYALNPDIFVLDEPSSNLDPEAIQELRRLLLLIKAQGKTIIVSEHRLYFLNGIADRIVLMEHGKLKQSWSASDFALLNTEQIKALGLRSYREKNVRDTGFYTHGFEPSCLRFSALSSVWNMKEQLQFFMGARRYVCAARQFCESPHLSHGAGI